MKRHCISIWALGLTVLTLAACNKTAVIVVAPPSPASVESSRIARRLSFIAEADDDFIIGNTNGPKRTYTNEMRDNSPVVSHIAKRKLASVYEVLGQEKESLALLEELGAEKDSSFTTDPLTILKTLYFSDRLNNTKGFEAALVRAAPVQKKTYSVLNDPRIAPGPRRNTFYYLATEAGQAKDWKLYNWALAHAEKVKPLSDQQLLEVATTLEAPDPKRALSMILHLEPKFTGEEKTHVDALKLRLTRNLVAKDSLAKDGKPIIASNQSKLNVEKFGSTGYWTTGAKPVIENHPARMRQSR